MIFNCSTNEDGITPMHQAASEGHVQCLKTLIEVGGIIDGQDKRNMKPIDMSKLWGHRKCARLVEYSFICSHTNAHINCHDEEKLFT